MHDSIWFEINGKPTAVIATDVFVDAADKGLKKIAITGYSQESVAHFFEKSNEAQPDMVKELRALWDTYHPARIAPHIATRSATATATIARTFGTK